MDDAKNYNQIYTTHGLSDRSNYLTDLDGTDRVGAP